MLHPKMDPKDPQDAWALAKDVVFRESVEDFRTLMSFGSLSKDNLGELLREALNRGACEMITEIVAQGLRPKDFQEGAQTIWNSLTADPNKKHEKAAQALLASGDYWATPDGAFLALRLQCGLGRLDKATELLAKHRSFFQPDDLDMALVWAIQKGGKRLLSNRQDLVLLLLKEKGVVSLGPKPLGAAITAHDLGLVKLLFDAGADPNAGDPLEHACGALALAPNASELVKIANFLLEKGAEVSSEALIQAFKAAEFTGARPIFWRSLPKERNGLKHSLSGDLFERILKAAPKAVLSEFANMEPPIPILDAELVRFAKSELGRRLALILKGPKKSKGPSLEI
jgi:hypothetical protein